MTLRVLVVLCLAAGAGSAADPGPIDAPLVAAKATFEVETAKARKAVNDVLVEREKAARTAGVKKDLDQVKTDRLEFEGRGLLPQAVNTASYVRDMRLAHGKLATAYAAAIQAYTKAGADDRAGAVEKEFDGFRRAFLKANQGLATAVGSVWVHPGGTFEVSKKGAWQETWDGKPTFTFREVERGRDFVLLHDPTRDCRVWLRGNRCSVQIGRGRITDPYLGGWDK